MNYRIPPDILHYELRLMFGLTAQDIMISGMCVIFGLQALGIAAGLAGGVLSLAALKRFERFGNRSPLVYFGLWVWHKYRPQQVFMPRVMPSGEDLRLTVQDWEGREMYRLGGREE